MGLCGLLNNNGALNAILIPVVSNMLCSFFYHCCSVYHHSNYHWSWLILIGYLLDLCMLIVPISYYHEIVMLITVSREIGAKENIRKLRIGSSISEKIFVNDTRVLSIFMQNARMKSSARTS